MGSTYRKIGFNLCLILAAVGVWAIGTASAGEPADIKTRTGVVTAIEDRGEVIMYGSLKFYPAVEIRRKHQWPRPGIPEWITVGSEVAISYYERGYTRYFLDLVRPGEDFPVKNALERARKRPH